MTYPKYLKYETSFVKMLSASQMVTVTIAEKIEGREETVTGVNLFTLDPTDNHFDPIGCNESTRQEFEKAFGEAMYQFAKTGATV